MSDKKIKIGYLGPEGTFSYIALKSFLANEQIKEELKNAELNEFDAFFFIHTYLLGLDDNNQYFKNKKIFIPVENSIGGSITGNMDILFANNKVDPNIQIEAEHIQPISHAIANLTGDFNDIKVIASHEQPLAQCSTYIVNIMEKYNMDELEKWPTASTVEGIKYAAKDKTVAAIAPYQTLVDAGLKILDNNIEDVKNNATRFLLIGRDKTKSTGHDKTSIAITLPSDKAGALYEVLGVLAKSDKSINMTRIESRPAKVEMGEYWFFIDIEGHQDDSHIGRALDQIKKKSKEYKFLGSYPRFRR